jgi:hypothetical protein
MRQRTKFKIIIYSILLVIAISLLMVWWSYTRALGRDYQRLADMKLLQVELTDYFTNFNTYKIPECQSNSPVNFCTGKGDRTMAVEGIIDPTSSGSYQYIIGELTDSEYRVYFSFEIGVGGLDAGGYTLTKSGIVVR